MSGKYRVLSMFSNVGIAETYFKELGFEVKVANELLPERARFYKHLYPETDMICGDITDKTVFETVKNAAIKNDVNMLVATPPCQGMSCAGKKDPLDPRNYLIYYAVEMIKAIKPTYVLLENVPMQMHTRINYKGKEVLIPEYLETELGEIYSFNKNRVVNSQDYGVPQSRQRYICLMVKKSKKVSWEFPQPNGQITTLREAIGHLPSLDPLLREEKERYRFPDYEVKREAGLKVSKWHIPPVHSWKQIEWMMHTPSGTSAFKNDYHFPKKDNRRIKGAPRTYMRMDWDKPATTVLQNSGVISTFSTVHPGRPIVESTDDKERIYSDARVLTIYELLIVSSLPLDWNIPEWADDILIRKVIGEGIPPRLISAALNALLEVEKC